MRLVHLSDLHLGGSEHPKKQLQRMIGLLDVALEEKPDHVLLGGDLVDSGDLDDLKPFIKHLKQRQLMKAERLSVVPGNHDIWPFSESKMQGMGGASIGALKELVEFVRKKMNWPAQHRYDAFCEAFAPTFKHAETQYKGDPYPSVKFLDDVAIALLDTTSDSILSSAQGRFKTGEGDFIIESLEDHDGVQLLLHHHVPEDIGQFIDFDDYPWVVRKPVEKLAEALGIDLEALVDPNFEKVKKVRKFIKEAAFDAVFCGHLHMVGDEPQDDDFDGWVGKVPYYCMGRSGGMGQSWKHAELAYHVIDIDGGNVSVETKFVDASDLD